MNKQDARKFRPRVFLAHSESRKNEGPVDPYPREWWIQGWGQQGKPIAQQRQTPAPKMQAL